MAIRDALTRPRNWAAGTAILLAAIVEASLWIPGFYDELVAWQTAIAALFGFGGLIAAGLFGFRNVIRAQEHRAELNRASDDRQRAREQFGLALIVRAEIRYVTAQISTVGTFLNDLASGGEDGDAALSNLEVQRLLVPPGAPATERAIMHAGVISPDATTFVVGWSQALEGFRRLNSAELDSAALLPVPPDRLKAYRDIIATVGEIGDRAVEILSRDLTEIGTEHGWRVPPAIEEQVKLMEAMIGPKPDAKGGET